MADPIRSGAGPDDAEVICIVVHGRGQSQADMMAAVVDRLSVPRVRFVLPKSDGPGWYAARAVDPLTDATRRELDTGLAQVAGLIARERRQAPGRPVLLCGFSQGACLAMELLMRDAGAADAACLLTGCRVGAASDDLPTAPLPGLPVYASCGDADPWIPVRSHQQMLETLAGAGARVRSDMFPGRPHTVSDTEIDMLAAMLAAMAAGRPMFAGAA